MQIRALYDNGHITFLDKVLPPGTMEIIIEIPDEKIPSLSDEWKNEIDRRIDEIDSGKAKLHPGEEVLDQLLKKY
ncbi:MAG: addiction module protein [Lentisphaeraceae bacterium]|nr:addiction module protein [Lentisphaeraceae bacterium]